jgi:hypothetical protein
VARDHEMLSASRVPEQRVWHPAMYAFNSSPNPTYVLTGERERETRRAGAGSSGHELEESGGRRLAGAHTCGPASEDRGGPAARASPSDPTASPPPAGNYSQ